MQVTENVIFIKQINTTRIAFLHRLKTPVLHENLTLLCAEAETSEDHVLFFLCLAFDYGCWRLE